MSKVSMITEVTDVGAVDLPHSNITDIHRVLQTERGFVAIEFSTDYECTIREVNLSYYSREKDYQQVLSIFERIDETAKSLPVNRDGNVDITDDDTLTVTMPRGSRFHVKIIEPARQLLRPKIGDCLLNGILVTYVCLFIYAEKPISFLLFFPAITFYLAVALVILGITLLTKRYFLTFPDHKAVGAWKPHYFSVRRQWFRRKPQSELSSS